LIVESEVRKTASIKQINKQVKKQLKNVKVALRELSRQKFACQADAETAINQLSDSWKYHKITEIKCREKAIKKSKATAKLATKPETRGYEITGEIEIRESVISAETIKAGRFILATNILDKNELSQREILSEYKAQQSNERGFRFLKGP
jgi:transposase